MLGPDAQVLLELALNLCDDLAVWFPTLAGGLQRDKRYIANRVGSEGLSFLTKGLPKFGKAFDNWLRDESLASAYAPEAFAPTFLSGVKDLISGTRISDSDRAVVYCWVRQLSYLFYKLEVPYSVAQLTESFAQFEQRNQSLEDSDAFSPFETGEAARYLGSAMEGFSCSPLTPKHGPGAVATGEVGEEKWAFKRHYASAHHVYPWYEYFVPCLRVWSSDPSYALTWYKSLERLPFPEARMIAVPKDSRGPRLISEEPLEIQYLQQGLLNRLVPFCERESRATRGFVNFTNQEINGDLALQASKTGEWATIDLADASDRVSDYLVYLLFPGSIYRHLHALRSHYTILPTGKKVRLNMFAPMGSAICFPIQALTFWALCKGAIHKSAATGDSRVYVYGDDIIVPNDKYSVVCEGLEAVGLRVNHSKSYHTGFFRESCGVEAWKGHIVTPLRLKHLPPSRRNDVKGLSNWIAIHNGLLSRSYNLTSARLRTAVEQVVKVPWNIHGTPLSFQDSDLLSDELELRNAKFPRRWNPKWHRWESKFPVVRQGHENSCLSDWCRLHRDLLMMPRDPDRWQRRNAVSLETKWIGHRSVIEEP